MKNRFQPHTDTLNDILCVFIIYREDAQPHLQRTGVFDWGGRLRKNCRWALLVIDRHGWNPMKSQRAYLERNKRIIKMPCGCSWLCLCVTKMHQWCTWWFDVWACVIIGKHGRRDEHTDICFYVLNQGSRLYHVACAHESTNANHLWLGKTNEIQDLTSSVRGWRCGTCPYIYIYISI